MALARPNGSPALRIFWDEHQGRLFALWSQSCKDMVSVCQGITRGHEGQSYQAERCEMTFGEWQTPSGLRVWVLVTFNTSPTSWLCVRIIDTCLFFLILLCFRFLSVVLLRVLKSQVPLGWKWSDPKKPHTVPGIISRSLWRQLGCH